MGNCNWLQEMTWEKIQQSIEDSFKTIIMPFGSTEQHGHHLPVGTDTMVAIAIAEDASEKTGVPVSPPMWFGWSPHHMVLPGTITIRPEILVEMAFDTISSLSHHGFENFILINGHRIVNISWMQIACERAKRELDVNPVIFDPAFMSKSIISSIGWGSVGHAEEIETSHMMYKYPDLVRMDKAIDNPHINKKLYSVDPSFEGDTLCYVPSSIKEMEYSVKTAGGTSGEPSKAFVKGGKIYHDHLVSRLVDVIHDFQK